MVFDVQQKGIGADRSQETPQEIGVDNQIRLRYLDFNCFRLIDVSIYWAVSEPLHNSNSLGKGETDEDYKGRSHRGATA